MAVETSPKGLGEMLKDARAIKHLSLEDAEQATKIRLRYLQALEEGRYHELPPDVFAVGFVRRYAKALELDPQEVVTLFRRERAKKKPARGRVSFGPPKVTTRPPVVLSQRLLISTIIILVVLLLFGYIWYQVRLFASPPHLTITEPPDNSVVTTEMVTVVGKTSPTATLFINNEPIPLDEAGGFRQDVRLTAGVNTIELKAVSRLGKEESKSINVLFEEAAPSVVPLDETMNPP